MFSRSVTLRSRRSRRKPATAASLARSGARERSTSSASSVASQRTSAAGGGSSRALWRNSPTTSPPARSSIMSPSASTARSSAGDAQATASTPPEASTTITLDASAREVARATSGSPAPVSMAAVTSATASRNALAGGPSTRFDEASMRGQSRRAAGCLRSRRPLCPVVVGPDDRGADAHTYSQERREDEERHEAGRDPLPPATVGHPRGDDDQRDVGGERHQ